ncbi:hypothetical protein [Parvularcula lutaonensis]|uniref:Uncharacterized protein n=1 Tax=Parvularcula lutaonensis TaxID=491923 RepID=A0ABV7MD13_9PROT|nr:hypothetical protein [Parvularcula lutaonensis]GGY51467.1 hypothetical protein GCM10007148_20440 [Parvularcula lutaonensis]
MLTTTLAAALALTAQGPTDYTVEILYQEKRFLLSRTYQVSEEIDLRDGSFEVPDPANGEGPLLSGEVKLQGGEVLAVMEICAPGSDPCEVAGEPELRFSLGARATIRESTGRAVWRVVFKPN